MAGIEYTISVQGRMDLSKDLIRKAKWELASAQAKSRTKKEMNEMINEAVKKIIEAELLLYGFAG